MKTIRLVIACGVTMLAVRVSGQSSQTAPAPTPPVARAQAADAAPQRALVDRYCVGCHNAKLLTANLSLDKLDLGHLGDHA